VIDVISKNETTQGALSVKRGSICCLPLVTPGVLISKRIRMFYEIGNVLKLSSILKTITRCVILRFYCGGILLQHFFVCSFLWLFSLGFGQILYNK
jgi:hypothetical protein